MNPRPYPAQTLRLVIVSCLCLLFSAAAVAETQSRADRWRSAISNDQSDVLRKMLASAADKPKLLSLAASNGKNALMVACKNGELELAQHMVEMGARMDARTQTGGTALMFSVLGNHAAVADWLLENGADLDAQGSNGWSAATIAGAKGFDQMLSWLIKAGADVDAADVYQFTPLMRAVDNYHLKAATLLLQKEVADVNHTDESDNTALHFAVANQQREMVALLLKHGADPLHENRDGITPKQMARDSDAITDLFN